MRFVEAQALKSQAQALKASPSQARTSLVYTHPSAEHPTKGNSQLYTVPFIPLAPAVSVSTATASVPFVPLTVSALVTAPFVTAAPSAISVYEPSADATTAAPIAAAVDDRSDTSAAFVPVSVRVIAPIAAATIAIATAALVSRVPRRRSTAAAPVPCRDHGFR